VVKNSCKVRSTATGIKPFLESLRFDELLRLPPPQSQWGQTKTTSQFLKAQLSEAIPEAGLVELTDFGSGPPTWPLTDGVLEYNDATDLLYDVTHANAHFAFLDARGAHLVDGHLEVMVEGGQFRTASGERKNRVPHSLRGQLLFFWFQ
jgi:hypothetical protein